MAHVDVLSQSQLFRLLEIRQASHPGDVLEHDATLIDRQLHDSRDKHRFRRAICLLPRLRAAHLALGDPEGFDASSVSSELNTGAGQLSSLSSRLLDSEVLAEMSQAPNALSGAACTKW